MGAPECYCGAPMQLRQSRHGTFYGCTNWPECDGLIGCHPGTEVPLGKPASKAVRQARVRAHKALDALWQPMGGERRKYRDAAYRFLAEELGVNDPHIGEMDGDDCEFVIMTCEGMGPEDLEEWLEERR